MIKQFILAVKLINILRRYHVTDVTIKDGMRSYTFVSKERAAVLCVMNNDSPIRSD